MSSAETITDQFSSHLQQSILVRTRQMKGVRTQASVTRNGDASSRFAHMAWLQVIGGKSPSKSIDVQTLLPNLVAGTLERSTGV